MISPMTIKKKQNYMEGEEVSWCHYRGNKNELFGVMLLFHIPLVMVVTGIYTYVKTIELYIKNRKVKKILNKVLQD